MCPALWASFTPSKRGFASCSPEITFHVSSLLPSSTSMIRLSGAMISLETMSFVNSVSRFAVIGSASCSL